MWDRSVSSMVRELITFIVYSPVGTPMYRQIMEAPFLIDALSALAQPHRLRAYALIAASGTEGMSPGALADALGMERNHLIVHLAILVDAGLISRIDHGRTATLTRNEKVSARLSVDIDALLAGGVVPGYRSLSTHSDRHAVGM
ncbi:DNA-binding transcriptional ArsR family regulator [Sphingomonas sp. PP-CC-3A-396]|nr:DNA-binding transcriptional ArsR family regulator [Sphingomonas sp. PP-CC-3A-396]